MSPTPCWFCITTMTEPFKRLMNLAYQQVHHETNYDDWVRSFCDEHQIDFAAAMLKVETLCA